MTGDPAELIDPSKLPVDPTTCKPVYPHEYLRVNTIFEVAKETGLRTAWVDKHPAYDLLQGPSGEGIDDLFTPEINSDAPTEGSANDWTTDNALTEQYDGYKVQAVVNEIKGFDHSGTEKVGTPAIFGMNFQTVSTAEKLPESDGLKGGYEADGTTPAPLLRRALEYINTKVGSMLAALHAKGLASSTTVILSAKHGQSPDTPSALTRIPDGPILEGLDEAWATAHPEDTEPLVAFSIDDDGMLIWLHYRTPEALAFAKQLPARRQRHRQRHRRQPEALHQLRAEDALRGRRSCRILRHLDQRPAGAGPVRHRPVRDRLHRRPGQDRRARRGQPAGPRRPAGRLRRPGRPALGRLADGRDDADRTDHPQPARARPGRAGSG